MANVTRIDRTAENVRDAELVRKWQAGDKDAGDRLVKIHHQAVRLYFLSRAPLEHEDLVQDTFRGLVASLPNYRGDAPFRAYLFTIARNVLCRHLRECYEWQGMTLDSSLAAITGVSASSLVSAKEELRLLFDAMRKLSIDDQDLLELYHWQGLTARELGALFDVAEGTIRSRIRAATDRLVVAANELARGQHEREFDADMIERWLEDLRAEVERRRPPLAAKS